VGNHEQALQHLFASKSEADHQPMMADWYFRMPLQSALTEAWLVKGDQENARIEAAEFLRVALATGERTYRALAYEVNARLAMAEQNFDLANDCIAKALRKMEGHEVPLAHWRVHATAAELHRLLGSRKLAEQHRESSCATIMKLANSLPADEPLRKTFLSAPPIRTILDEVPIEKALPRAKKA